MKNIMMAAALIVISFAFVSEINAKDVGSISWDEAVEGAVPLEMLGSTTPAMIAEDSSVPAIKVPKGTFEPEPAEPKFSARIGLGNAYKLGVEFKGKKIESELGNSPTFTAKLGYSLNKYVEVQGEYSRATNFGKHEEEEDAFGNKGESNEQDVISAYTVNLKLTVPLTIEKVNFSPYIFGGLGRATWTNIYNEKMYSYGRKWWDETETESYAGTCFKAGAGVDLKVYKNLFLFSEYSFQKINLRIDGQAITLFYSQTTGGIGLKF